MIYRDVDDFAQEAEQADDITCVVLRCRPAFRQGSQGQE